jgi:peptidoglycan/LPS O-acetylase OafA/YrhL
VAPADHHTALDGLRGWAALAVVLYHTILSYGPDLTAVMILPPRQLGNASDILAWVTLTVANGSFAVTLFFILSGLVLAESLQRTADEPIGRVWIAFSLRRTLRLMPPLVAGVLFSFLVGHAMARLGLGDVRARTAAQLFDNLTLTSFKVNGATWTIQVEMLVIPIMLVAFALQRTLGQVTIFLTLVAAIQLVPHTTLFGDRLTYLNDALLAFAAGMLLSQPAFKQMLATRHRHAPWLLLAAFLFSRPLPGWGSHAAIVTQILIGAALIGNLAVSASSLADLLNTRPSQFLGRISYSFYLLNVPLIWVCEAVLPFATPNEQPIFTGFLLFIVVTLLTIPLAIASVRLIEAPSMKLGREWARRLTRPAAPLPPSRGAYPAE